MDPAERWKRHRPALVAALLIGLVVVNLSTVLDSAAFWGTFAAYVAVLLVTSKLGWFGP